MYKHKFTNGTNLADKIFEANLTNFEKLALEVFYFQYTNNAVYRQYCSLLQIDINKIDAVSKIPFLPIKFFKTHKIATTEFVPAAIFESSGTTHTINSKHYVKDINLYKHSFIAAFEMQYGKIEDWCILALLPSYLERDNSSLVMMADELIKQSNHSLSGFYLNEFDKLKNTIQLLESAKQKTLLIGVTFALLDFAKTHTMPLSNTVIIETGGMKGRGEEMTRQQVHNILCTAFSQTTIHSEYGMTELLSQTYSKQKGIFTAPPWVKILIREEDDPFAIHSATTAGAINIIDLANVYSCSFIATDDAGKLYNDGSFEVLGRLDNSDIRGCSLMAL